MRVIDFEENIGIIGQSANGETKPPNCHPLTAELTCSVIYGEYPFKRMWEKNFWRVSCQDSGSILIPEPPELTYVSPDLFGAGFGQALLPLR
jgi:hypothetical protein